MACILASERLTGSQLLLVGDNAGQTYEWEVPLDVLAAASTGAESYVAERLREHVIAPRRATAYTVKLFRVWAERPVVDERLIDVATQRLHEEGGVGGWMVTYGLPLTHHKGSTAGMTRWLGFDPWTTTWWIMGR